MLDKLKVWHKTMSDIDAECERLSSIFNGACESDLFRAIYEVQDQYTKLVSESVGDKSEMLNWYWLDNNMGKNGYEVRIGENYTFVRSLEDLETVIKLVGEAE